MACFVFLLCPLNGISKGSNHFETIGHLPNPFWALGWFPVKPSGCRKRGTPQMFSFRCPSRSSSSEVRIRVRVFFFFFFSVVYFNRGTLPEKGTTGGPSPSNQTKAQPLATLAFRQSPSSPTPGTGLRRNFIAPSRAQRNMKTTFYGKSHQKSGAFCHPFSKMSERVGVPSTKASAKLPR